IGAVARVAIATRHDGEPHAWAIEVDAGAKSEVKPAALSDGTRVEVRDLFYATPARLKFLKTDRTEAEAIRDVVRRLAMSRPEVRFRDSGLVRASIVRALQEALARDAQRTATTGGAATIAAFRPNSAPRRRWDWRNSPAYPTQGATALAGFAEAAQAAFETGAPAAQQVVADAAPDLVDRPLGAARAQLHETYIVAQTRGGIVIVDQHAAHERLVYERMKAALDKIGVARQLLLIPEIVELDETDVGRLTERAGEL